MRLSSLNESEYEGLDDEDEFDEDVAECLASVNGGGYTAGMWHYPDGGDTHLIFNDQRTPDIWITDEDYDEWCAVARIVYHALPDVAPTSDIQHITNVLWNILSEMANGGDQ